MIKITTAQRLKEAMEKKGLRQVDVIERAKPYFEKYNSKLSKQDLSQYISGKVEPGQRKLSILAAALGVNEAWLMGLDVPDAPYEKEKSALPNDDSALNAMILERFAMLTPENRLAVLEFLEQKLRNQGNI